MKSGTRILGVDDASFSKDQDQARIVGVVYRGTQFVEDIRFSKVEIDGDDATRKVKELYENCSGPDHIRVLITDGICLAGFNPLRLQKIHSEIDIPVIAVTKNQPHRTKMLEALEKLDKDSSFLQSLEEPIELPINSSSVFLHHVGLSKDEATSLIHDICINGAVPEPVRLADLIGSRIEKSV